MRPDMLYVCFKYKFLQEWGAGIVNDNTNTEDDSNITVNVLHLSKYVLDTVAKRELPKAKNKTWTREPTVLMKLDIEGVNDCAAFKTVIITLLLIVAIAFIL